VRNGILYGVASGLGLDAFAVAYLCGGTLGLLLQAAWLLRTRLSA
jgi:hypothetical protein